MTILRVIFSLGFALGLFGFITGVIIHSDFNLIVGGTGAILNAFLLGRTWS